VIRCAHGLTSHGASIGSKSTEPGVMLAAHHAALKRCTCRLAGAAVPASRPAVMERKAAPRFTTVRPEEKAKQEEDALLRSRGVRRVPHERIPHEAWMAVQPSLRLARDEFGLGRVEPRFVERLDPADPIEGFMFEHVKGVFWIVVDQTIDKLCEVSHHEVKHLAQIASGDRRPADVLEVEAKAHALRWFGITRTKAYAC
jgi:hypothetical protein